MVGIDIAPLRELAYSAALDDALWEAFAFRAAKRFGSHGALFWVVDVERGEMLNGNAVFNDRDGNAVMREYLGGPVEHDPQMARVAASTMTEVYTDQDHLDLTDREVRAYLDWQVRACGTRHHLTSCIALTPSIRAGISLHRSEEAGPADAELRCGLERLTVDLAEAVRLGYAHNASLQEAWWDGATHLPGKAAILFDSCGQVVRLSGPAKAVIDRVAALTVRKSRLVTLEPSDQNRLDAVIARASRDREARAGAMMLPLAKGRLLRFAVYPLTTERRYLAPFRAAALAYLDDLSEPGCGSGYQADLYDLTRREAEIAQLLVSGCSLDAIAAQLKISRNTVRNHLQSLFEKTGTRRQADLMRALLVVS